MRIDGLTTKQFIDSVRRMTRDATKQQTGSAIPFRKRDYLPLEQHRLELDDKHIVVLDMLKHRQTKVAWTNLYMVCHERRCTVVSDDFGEKVKQWNDEIILPLANEEHWIINHFRFGKFMAIVPEERQ